MFELGGKDFRDETRRPEARGVAALGHGIRIAPNAFNYKNIVGNLKMLSPVAREVGVPLFYSVQTGFNLLKERAGVWVRVRKKRAKATEPLQLLK